MDAEPIPVVGGITESPAEIIARAVLAHPSVVRLDGGRFGDIASPLPGRRVVGVRAGTPAEGVEVAVVLRFGDPIPAVVDELRAMVRGIAGPVPVDVAVVDVVTEPLRSP